MKSLKKLLLTSIISLLGLSYFSMFSLTYAQNVYDDVLSQTTINHKDDNKGSLSSAINGGDVVTDERGSKLFNDQVNKIIGYVIDIFIVVGIAIAFFGGYEIMTSDKDEKMKEGIRLVIFGILGIIIMVSARFLASSLVGDSGVITQEFSNPVDNYQPNGIQLADNLYNKIMYPFIKIALYFVIGVIFFIMVGKVVGFVTATDDSAKKKAGEIIIWCVVGILMVMGSKQIVEAVMGNQNSVLKYEVKGPGGEIIENAPSRIDEQGNPILEFGSIPLIAQIINWVMGLTMFAIVVLVIIQGYKILTKPDDPKTMESLKKAALYILVGVLVIGAAYVISNVLVVDNVPIDTVSPV